MDLLQMCGEEILRLASSRRRGIDAKRIVPGDVVHELMCAVLQTADKERDLRAA